MELDTLEKLIQRIVPCEHLELSAEGHHYFIKVVSSQFEGLSRLQRHRLIKDGLAKEFSTNELHALSITKALTPKEWEKNHSKPI